MTGCIIDSTQFRYTRQAKYVAFLFGCEGIHLEYPAKTVLGNVTLGVHEGDRIGIVGQNGDGKSTLLGVLAGLVEPDEGLVRHTRGLRIGMLGQRDSLEDEASVEYAVVGDTPEYVWAGDPRVREVISALIADIAWDAKVKTLSGGQRRRVDLARLLVGDWDVLMLDEPTNHLDMHAIAWLAAYLNRRWPKGTGALLTVTHDRWFLDEVANAMWEVHDGLVDPFEGGYSAYVLQRVERDRVAQVTEQKRKNLMRKELAWLSRGARARSTKPKFHMALAQELIAEEPPVRNTLELRAMAMQRLGKQCVELTRVTERFGDRTVLDNVDWIIGPGDRIGVLGENGAGKTTLLKIIQGALKPTSGFVKIGKTVKFAVLSQRLDELEEMSKYRVTEVLSRYRTRVVLDGKETTPAKLLERLGFSSRHLYTRICDLSGGQKRRLQLLLILLDEPNVLILDEPGNDLDTDMLAVLEDLLDTWAGTLVMVTHDRYLMERVTDDQYALVGGKLRHCPRGVDEYLELLDERNRSAASGRTFADVTGQGAAAQAQQGASLKASDSGYTNAELREMKKRLASLNKKMGTAARKVEDKQAEMDGADPTDFVRLGELQAELDELRAAKEALEDEWLELADALGVE
ncbi:ABC-F family ATP-binding cassette domain-containing protein [uncultured Slackia sp.]|uniref:ABC-F family ATP-binding cassette domain-containing protein n=1 Tax=uncultured Slackia sp. TaxID=665903 RepID=UPI002803B6A4|nr:ABC-F family ATP-binding cassette domain-containing protein [uncultured Slackia sp.]